MILTIGVALLHYDSSMTSPEVEETLAEIRRRVAQRRQNGDYPPGLESELESEFRAVVSRERRDWYATSTRLDEQMQRVLDALGHLGGMAETSSRVPGGSLVHKVVRRIIRRQVDVIGTQVRNVSNETVVLLRMIVELQKAQEDADRRLVSHLARSVMDRLAVVDHLAVTLTDLERRFDSQFPR